MDSRFDILQLQKAASNRLETTFYTNSFGLACPRSVHGALIGGRG
jgi:hypothetical protein